VAHLAADRGLAVRIALAHTRTSAWLLAHARNAPTIVAAGNEAAALATLPIGVLATLAEAGHQPGNVGLPSAYCSQCLTVFIRWGLHTVGELARLPRAELHARLGPAGVRLHQAARGEDAAPLVPAADSPRFAERLELEWPIEGLEPLSFVLARLCDQLSAALERADRGAVGLTSRLRLVTRETHERVLALPAPLRDARVLRTLILLDLESHPPAAAIDVVDIEAAVTPGRIVQGSLLAHTLPSVEDLSTLLARLRALMGESRVGAPRLPDTLDDRAVAMTAFQVDRQGRPTGLLPFAFCLVPCLRRFRLPIAARVTVERGAPVRVQPAVRGLRGGRVLASAGPWRTSGRWWALDRSGWNREEWDVELIDGGVYRLARDRATGSWEIEGVVD
jgi:protein ImuB